MGISERRSLSAARHGSNVAWARSALRWCAVAPLSLLLTACHWAVLDPRGPVGQADRTILIEAPRDLVFRDEIAKVPEIASRLSPEKLSRAFDYNRQLANVDAIFARVLGE